MDGLEHANIRSLTADTVKQKRKQKLALGAGGHSSGEDPAKRSSESEGEEAAQPARSAWVGGPRAHTWTHDRCLQPGRPGHSGPPTEGRRPLT